MSDQVDAFSLKPEEATAKLEEMTAAYRATQPVTPQDKLNEFYGDKENRAKLEAGDPATRRQFDELARAAAVVEDPVKAAMTGALPEVPSSELREMSELTSWLRGLGIRDEVVRQTLSDQEVTPAEHDFARRWKEQHLSNAEWTEKWLKGDAEAARDMTLANIIITSPIKKAAA